MRIANAGLFTNTQMHEYLSSVINKCSIANEYQALQEASATEGIAGCVAVPASSTVHQANGIAGYANTLAASSAGTTNNAVGVYGQCRNLANASACWGLNNVVQDVTGMTGHIMIGNEVDVNLKGIPDRLHGILVTGLPETGTMPAAPPPGNTNGSLARADLLEFFFENGLSFPAGIVFSRGSVNGTGLQLDGTCNTGSAPCVSQSVTYTSYDNSDQPHTVVDLSGYGVPTMNCAVGSTYRNSAAASASTVFYVCYPANTWSAAEVR